ncbi:MAG: L-fucose:H+ symporter permease [Spirosomataceae bacterium]
MAALPSSSPAPLQEGNAGNRYLVPFILVTSLFFLWAFVHNLEPILIPHLKKACQLTDLQSALIDSAVYLGYFIMAIPAGLVMKKYGYKKGILVGLLLYALGAFLFYPAADTRVYLWFLGALFIIASGCAFLETAANPYVTILGDADSATTRLNLSQSFNGLGAFIAPVLGGQLILSGIEHSKEELAGMSSEQLSQYLQSEADSVKMPYIVIGLVVLAVAGLIYVTQMPEVPKSNDSSKSSSISSVLKIKHLSWGVIAQFFYVGAQVCVTSFFIRFAKFTNDTPEKEAAAWLGIAMLGFMIGRFVGTFLTRFLSANRLLTIYALCSILLLAVACLWKSEMAVWALMTVPFFESIMFPTIFSLAIKDLKEHTELGSSLVVMSIAGGALFPLIMGWISDQSNIQMAYIVPLICFFVIVYYGLIGYKPRPESA